MVEKFWKLRTIFQSKMVVDLVHSRDSKFLNIRAKFLDQVNL